MKKKLLFSLASLALVSCGGGNDVASSGASAVSAAAPTKTNTASAPSTPARTATEPKVNGQIDERTGVAPDVAAMTVGGTKGGGTGGVCLSESCCPTPSEVGACLLKYYPSCQLNAAYIVINPSCVCTNPNCTENSLYTVSGGDMYGCAGQENICWFSTGEGSSMTMKSKAGSSLIVKK